jgi:hypothetical protein
MKIHKCIGPSDLESSTREGWTLDQVLVCDKNTLIPHSASNSAPATPGLFHLSTVNVESPAIIREPMFLLSRNGEEEKLEAHWKKEAERVEKLLHELKAEHQKTKAERDCYKEEADRRTRELNSSVDVQRKMMVTKERLERDLGKVREAIGQIKFDEIIGPL